MCQQVICPDCGKPTWTGCGNHIDITLAAVPEEDRCHHKAPSQMIHDARHGFLGGSSFCAHGHGGRGHGAGAKDGAQLKIPCSIQ